MPDKVIQLIRTGVQAVIAFGLSKLLAFPALHAVGVELSDDVENFLTNVAIVVYVAVVNALAARWPVLEWLNGYRAAPNYVATSPGPDAGN